MVNKNISQLPENTDPQATDWLLLASGDSPTVFQKAAVGNLPGSSAGGSIKFALPINENYNLTSSGYYFTDAIAADIEIDCSSLGIGDHIYLQNISTKSIVFSGFNSIDSVSIPANKGVKINSANFIELFLKDTNKNIKKLQGNYLIDWIPGQAPPYIEFNFSSYNDQDIAYYLGTNENTESWQNPVSRNLIQLSLSGDTSSGQPSNIFNRSFSGNEWGFWQVGTTSLEIYFPSHLVAINKIALSGLSINGDNRVPALSFQSYDGSTWNPLINTTQLSPGEQGNWSALNDVFFDRYRFYITTGGFWRTISEAWLYGLFKNK